MERLKTPVDILKVLDKSNCRECGERTCLAFAAAVFQGRRSLDACTHLAPEAKRKYQSGAEASRPTIDEEMQASVRALKERVAGMDLVEAADRLGGRYAGGRLTLKVCGKDMHVDEEGNVTSEIHVHPWIVIPLLTYLVKGEGADVTGRWIPFRELRGGAAWQGLFEQRCEKPLRKVADEYTDLFEDMLHVFNGKRVENLFDSDISVVLYPLPKVPVLFCYQRPEEGMDSSLHIFLDADVERNLDTGGVYALIGGLVRMFENVARRHGTPATVA
jgi:hypothetical protein